MTLDIYGLKVKYVKLYGKNIQEHYEIDFFFFNFGEITQHTNYEELFSTKMRAAKEIL